MATVIDKDHAEIGPSGWTTWSRCAPSIALSEGQPNESSRYAKEGTAAHALLEQCLLENCDAETKIGNVFQVEGESFIVDMDMADAINTALAHIHELIQPERGDVLMVEERVPIDHLTGEPGAEGTSDVVGIVNGGRKLIVIDYKHGQGVLVRAKGEIKTDGVDVPLAHPPANGQLVMYALGTIQKLGLIYDKIETVQLVVLQPRLNWIDDIELPIQWLLNELYNDVQMAAGRVEQARQLYLTGGVDAIKDRLYPGEEQCRFCRAAAICPAARKVVSQTMAVVSQAADFENLSMSKQASSVVIDEHSDGAKFAEVLRAADMIENVLAKVGAEVHRRLMSGIPVPGFKLVAGKKGHRKWKDEEEAAKELTKSGRLSAADAYKKVPISPTEAEKKLKSRPAVWAKIVPLYDQAPGKPTIAPESDPRPLFELASPVSEFQNLSAAPVLSIEDLMS